jgi:phosphoribosylamine--glycine ligase
MAFTDGETVVPMLPAQDHKRVFDNDGGPNTGGMGAYAPAPHLDEEAVQQIMDTIMLPTVRALAAHGIPFRGALYAGLMLTEDGPKVLEFNARFGDPETQAIMPLLEGDLLAALLACAEGRLQPDMLGVSEGAAACIVLAAPGYPDAPRTGDMISGIEAADEPGALVFHAGTDWQNGYFGAPQQRPGIYYRRNAMHRAARHRQPPP